jgi:hypothetical protein
MFPDARTRSLDSTETHITEMLEMITLHPGETPGTAAKDHLGLPTIVMTTIHRLDAITVVTITITLIVRTTDTDGIPATKERRHESLETDIGNVERIGWTGL